jgi:DNA repair exonuclease SbcCD ATPase subunit
MRTVVTLKSKFEEAGLGEILAAKCQELAEETFTARLEELTRQTEELTEEDQRMNGVCDRLQKERDTLSNDLAECQNRNARLEGRVKQLGEVNTRQTDAIFEIKDRLNQKYEECEKLQAQIKELKEKPAYQVHFGPHPLELFTENAKLCFEVVRLNELLKTEKKAADALFVQRQEALKRLEEIEMKASELTPTIREFLTQQLKSVVTLNPLYVESLAQKIAGLVVSLKAKAINNTEANKRIAELAGLITEKNKRIEELEAKAPNGTVQKAAGSDVTAGALVASKQLQSTIGANKLLMENERKLLQKISALEAEVRGLTEENARAMKAIELGREQLEAEINAAGELAEELGRTQSTLGE